MPYYAVAVGRKTGIYHTWEECSKQTSGFPNSKFKKFDRESEATRYIRENSVISESVPVNSPVKPNNNPIAYYAVAVGHKPGIYHTWIECQQATEGFSRPKYRKFTTQEEAKRFLESNLSLPSQNSGGELNTVQFDQPKAFYAVAIGRQRGIYETWAQCKVQVENFEGPVYRKFDNREAAQKFIDENSPTKRKALPSFRGESFSKRGKRTDLEITSDGSIVAYTDGACVNNGKKHCAAGIGVFWGDNHPDNISRPLDGRPTNNRAEIHAAITAIRQAKKNGHLRIIIRTDSQFLINSATKWIDGWRKNGWKLSTGEPVINKQDFLELIDVMHGMERVTWEKVAAHKGIYGNEMADKLARDGVCRMEKKR